MLLTALAVPAVLVATWAATWFFGPSRRWFYYFPLALGALLVGAAVVFLWPQPECRSTAPMMCVSDLIFFGVANLFTGFWTWLGLLVITGFVEAVGYLARRRAELRPED